MMKSTDLGPAAAAIIPVPRRLPFQPVQPVENTAKCQKSLFPAIPFTLKSDLFLLYF